MGKVNISSMMGGNKFSGIIMDEVDGMSSGDKGGVSELISFINPNKGKRKKDKKKLSYQNPIICICNSDKDKKIQDLRKECEVLKYNIPKLSEITEFAEKVVKKEKIKVDEEKLLDLVTFSQRDIRKLLGNIQFLKLGHTKNKKLEINTCREEISDRMPDESNNLSGLDKKIEEASLFQSVFQVLESRPSIEEIVRISQSDRSLINLLVHENIISILQNYKTSDSSKIKSLEKIYSYIGESDMLESYLFHNYHHHISEINSILRCGACSYALDELPRNKNPTFRFEDLVFSKLMSKFSVQHQNYNHKMNLNLKTHSKNNSQDNLLQYQILIQQVIRSVNSKKLDASLEQYIREHELTIENLEKINKLLRNNLKGTKRENQFYSEATTEERNKLVSFN